MDMPVLTVEVGMDAGAVAEGSGVAPAVEGTLAGAGGAASTCAVVVGGASGEGAIVTEGGEGVGAAGVDVASVLSVVATSTAGSGTTATLVLSTAG